MSSLAGLFAGRYTIERELGRGATAQVYLARDQRHGIPVAIKVLKAEIAQTIGADRFLKEIRLSAGLHHPHIMPVLDSGAHQDLVYFTLPLAEGGTLRQRIATAKQLPLDDVLDITRTIASALDHAHAKGLIHRDVKPDNILFTSGQALLADFGLARALETSSAEVSTTSSGLIRGTPAYMSPEQASGETLDGRSDQFSLACVVYEMLSGMRPYDGPTAQTTIAMRFTDPPRPVKLYRPSLPRAIDAVLLRALTIAPADRYASCGEFVGALEAASTTVDVGEPASRPTSHSRAILIGGSIALAASAVVWASTRGSAPQGIPEGDARRVAVMYFDNQTPATLPGYVADGVTEDLIDQLGSVRALQVTSTYGVRSLRGSTIGIDSIRNVLKVGTIVTGSIARVGDSVRLNVRLVDAANGQQLAAVPLVAHAGNLLSLRSDLAERVAFSLRQRIGDRIALTANRATTRSQPAWENAQLASATLSRALSTFSVPLLLEADSLLERAAQADNSWDLPWIRRAHIALTLGVRATHAPESMDSVEYASMSITKRHATWVGIALSLADSALRRNPRSPQAIALRGEALYRLTTIRPMEDSIAAEAEGLLRSSLEIRPDAAGPWSTLANLMLAQGRYAEAAEAARRGYESDPYFESRRSLSTAFFTSLYAEHFNDARSWCRLAQSHYATDPRFTECELTLLGWSGRTGADLRTADSLVAAIDRADTLRFLEDTKSYRRMMLAAVAARAGATDSARRILQQIRSQSPRDTLSQNIAIGEAYVLLLLGERDGGLATLERYVRAVPAMSRTIARHPWFSGLRGDPRFDALGRDPN